MDRVYEARDNHPIVQTLERLGHKEKLKVDIHGFLRIRNTHGLLSVGCGV